MTISLFGDQKTSKNKGILLYRVGDLWPLWKAHSMARLTKWLKCLKARHQEYTCISKRITIHDALYNGFIWLNPSRTIWIKPLVINVMLRKVIHFTLMTAWLPIKLFSCQTKHFWISHEKLCGTNKCSTKPVNDWYITESTDMCLHNTDQHILTQLIP